MAIIPTNLARVSNTLRTNLLTQGLSRTQSQLLQVQNQIQSGDRFFAPSGDPGAASIVMQLQKTLENRAAYLANLNRATDQLSETGKTIGHVTDLLREAQTHASASVGSDVTPEARAGALEAVKSIYSQMLSLANTQFGGVYLFGGDRTSTPPFLESPGGVRFAGSNSQLSSSFDGSTLSTFTIGAAQVFGQVETRAGLGATLTPALTPSTRLSDLAGASGLGVRLGAVVLSDGVTSATIDLSAAGSIQDVITRINNAAVGSITAAIDPTGASIELTTTGADNITLTEAATGSTTAADLGILRTVGLGAGVPLTGASPRPRLTPLTPLGTVNGGALDLSSGIVITNGAQTATLDFSTDLTVQDLLRRINNSATGVRAAINADGTGVDLFNTVQGAPLTIAENGGLTATHLGFRTFAADTLLASLNSGQGVRTAGPAGPGLRITRSDGAHLDIDLSTAQTVGNVLSLINAAGAGTVTASLAATGNGIVIADSSGGPSPTLVRSINGSGAAEDLGLNVPSVPGVVSGRDVAPVYAAGVFTQLANLRDAMERGDQQAITAAAEALQAHYDQAVRTHGAVGAKVLDLDTRKTRLEDQNVATAAALANLKEVDMFEAITRFQMLQTALQASLQSAGKTLNLSLLDFLS